MPSDFRWLTPSLTPIQKRCYAVPLMTRNLNNKMSSKENRVHAKRHFFTLPRVILTALVLSLLIAFGSSSCNSSEEISKSREPVTRAPAAAMLPPTVRDVELTAVTGAPIKLSDYDGKVLLVNLWATWCGPCRMEIPELVKIHKEYHSKGLEMVGLSTENPDASAQGVEEFVQEFGMDYRVGWATREVSLGLMQGRDAIPQTFIISRDGRILKRFIGFNGAATPPQLRQAIEEALKS